MQLLKEYVPSRDSNRKPFSLSGCVRLRSVAFVWPTNCAGLFVSPCDGNEVERIQSVAKTSLLRG